MTVIDEFEELFAKFLGVKYAIACNNGTAALHAAVTALGVKQGDKVITTPFTFVSTANCILFNGGIPVFVDIIYKTLCIDPDEIEKALKKDPSIKGIIIVHLFGKTCSITRIAKICQKYDVFLIEDCAQSLGAKYQHSPFTKQYAGTVGDIGVFSFYASKNLSTFEGGMVVTNSGVLAEFIRMFINHGDRGKYEHVILGHNYRMPQICALIGLTQLKLHKIGMLAELGSYGIKTGHYPIVVYNQPLYKKLGIKGNCPIAEKAAKEARIYFRQ